MLFLCYSTWSLCYISSRVVSYVITKTLLHSYTRSQLVLHYCKEFATCRAGRYFASWTSITLLPDVSHVVTWCSLLVHGFWNVVTLCAEKNLLSHHYKYFYTMKSLVALCGKTLRCVCAEKSCHFLIRLLLHCLKAFVTSLHPGQTFVGLLKDKVHCLLTKKYCYLLKNCCTFTPWKLFCYLKKDFCCTFTQCNVLCF